MIVFLPVTRYHVAFEVAKGRPYSQFDQLVLRAIADGTGNVSQLARLFGMHRSIVIGTVVSLVQAGWVGIEADEAKTEYVVTSLGRDALANEADVPFDRRVDEKHVWIVVERLEGQIARGGQVVFWTRHELNCQADSVWNRGLILKPSDVKFSPEPGMIRPLLYADTEQGHYIRSIGPTNVVREGADYVPLLVSSDEEEIIGLPPDWESLLSEYLFHRVRTTEFKLDQKEIEADRDWFNSCVLPRVPVMRGARQAQEVPALVPEDYLDETDEEDFGGDNIVSLQQSPWVPLTTEVQRLETSDEHHAYLVTTLRNAKSFVVLAISDISDAFMRSTLMGELTRALSAGVNVDIISSISLKNAKEGQKAAIDTLREMEVASRTSSLKGRLMVGASQSALVSSTLLSDPNGSLEYALGTYKWCAPEELTGGPTIICHEPRLVASICRLIAERMSHDQNLRISRNASLLKKVAGELETTTHDVDGTGNCVAAVYNRQHLAFRHDLLAKATDETIQIGVGEFTAEHIDEVKRLGELRGGCSGNTISIEYFETTLNSVELADLSTEIASLGVRIQKTDAPRSNTLRAAGIELVSSFDWIAPRTRYSHADDVHIGHAVMQSETF